MTLPRRKKKPVRSSQAAAGRTQRHPGSRETPMKKLPATKVAMQQQKARIARERGFWTMY